MDVVRQDILGRSVLIQRGLLIRALHVLLCQHHPTPPCLQELLREPLEEVLAGEQVAKVLVVEGQAEANPEFSP